MNGSIWKISQGLVFVNWQKRKNFHQYSKRLGLIYGKKTGFMKELNLVFHSVFIYKTSELQIQFRESMN